MGLAHSLFNLSVIYVLAAMLPGPNTLVVTHLSASRSREAGLKASFGIVAGTILWVTLSLAGVGVLLLEAGWLYRIVRLAAGLYLIYAGWRIFAGRQAPENGGERTYVSKSPYITGFLTNLSNPKSAAFWTSVFIVLVPQHAPLWFYLVLVGMIAVEAMLWYSTLALLLSSGPARRNYQRFTRWADRVTGIVMIGLGIKLADEVRREVMSVTP